jgi:hypothetical protein
MMKKSNPTPHFLRVTQALAFVSGLGLPFSSACGGRAEECKAGECEDAFAADGPIATGTLPGPGLDAGFEATPGGDVGAAGEASLGEAEVADAGFSDGSFGEAGDATVRDATLDGGPLDPPEMPA